MITLMSKDRKILLAIVSVFGFWLVNTGLVAQVNAVEEGEGNASQGVQISDGSAILVEEKGFSIKPPQDWEVHKNYANSTLLFQIPYTPGIRYQRTIQVLTFNEPQFIDEITATRYKDILVRKFSEASRSVQGYRVRNYLPVELPDGSDGLLFYTEFTIDDVPLMQAHILVSSRTRHYLITYTDLAEHFESEKTTSTSQYLTTAWESMTSIQLDSQAPHRFEKSIKVVSSIIAAFLLVSLMIFLIRSRSAKQNEQAIKTFEQSQDIQDTSMPPPPFKASDVNSFIDKDIEVAEDDDELYDDTDIDFEDKKAG